MRAFRYESATDMRAAIDLIAAASNGAFLAGGTNLVDLMKLEVATPDVVVDIRRIASARVEELPEGGLRIGAAVTNSDLAADSIVRDRYPVLSQALVSAASGQLRNIATTGGNLLQRTRCPYFQNVTTPCNKREPGSGCSVLEGYQRDAAIFGASPACVATQPSDMAVALIALDATVRTQGPQGKRTLPLASLHRLPGDDPAVDTTLEHGELITAVDLPSLPFAVNSRYRKVRDRASFAFALVSVAAALEVDDGMVSNVRIALGGVAHKPWRATTAETRLTGGPATKTAFASAIRAELAAAEPLGGNAFKVPLAHNVVIRTLLDLAS